jgi:Rrf2 family transcriptional regulator, iron-sulfur cluster assembly transcription factor
MAACVAWSLAHLVVGIASATRAPRPIWCAFGCLSLLPEQELVALELNTRGRYAVMALADIAKFACNETVSLAVVAERQHLSVAYLEQLFVALRRAQLVESVRGRAGGYRLARAAATINIAEIMAAVEEDTRMTRCHDEPGGCVGSKRCLTHDLWSALGLNIQSFLAGITLQDVLDGKPKLRAMSGGVPL